VTGLKREYLGEFNKLHGGAAIGCEISPSSYTCQGNRHCLHPGYDRCDGLGKGWWGAKWLSFDGVALSGGMGAVRTGACCLPNAGGCTPDLLPDECAAANGVFAGPGTNCDDASVCLGACCLPSADCIETAFDACPGIYEGINTSCGEVQCPCPTPFADADGDGDVDQGDFAQFQACFTGPAPEPNGLPGGLPGGKCHCFDQHGGTENPDIDEDDYIVFEGCATGPGVPADPACEGP
jgi:hypothetical protein